LNNHARGPGFFTVVAATCVLGTEIVILTGRAEAAQVLWLAGIVLWVVVMYAFFTAAVVGETKPSLETGINGAWLLAIVSTQSVSVLGTMLAPGMGSGREGCSSRACTAGRHGSTSLSCAHLLSLHLRR
jgi:tellurite resistance protein TehA-like permease